ncbi:holocytochrome c synthase [Serendipita sp. 396]|nr:holocytochrome c synthase [Serendipita sp. 396]KAG8788440.1 holocytochrome c synthase [Serendipita sp. 397]KAG8802648.1 holocytochrome c synthase [Serendipita sp. 398]KAG8827277.1 holocytochrome c synthase [Serendipita sp. 401]KAG8872902.1 holocytochrome c synthase [Serendipita sp. 405]KAG9057851.1 holocytochrome c synthase [Serendipita sp. 407]
MGQTSSSPTTSNTDIHQTKPQVAGRCPVDHTTMKKAVDDTPAKCPVQHDVDPRNQMPTLQQHPISMNQAASLSTERVSSTIPRDDSSTWDYPSPQQFYNALVRKGWETPEEHIESMVDIHNFLNEKAWEEVVKWERRVDGATGLQLSRFKGRPGDISPKARMFMFAGRLFPSRFSSEPPFDRHDWIVKRAKTGEEVRYVIDYYSLPDEPNGTPVFSLDVRPALDSFSSIKERISVAAEEGWANFHQNQGSSSQTSS